MKLYNNIDDITVAIYDRILSERNLIHLIKKCDYFDWNSKKEWNLELYCQLKQVFAKIQEDYVNESGISEDYKDYMELERELLIVKCDYLITEDDFILNDIRELERQIKQTKPKGVNTTLSEEIVRINKILGHHELDSETTSLRKFINTKKAVNIQLKEDKKASEKASKKGR